MAYDFYTLGKIYWNFFYNWYILGISVILGDYQFELKKNNLKKFAKYVLAFSLKSAKFFLNN